MAIPEQEDDALLREQIEAAIAAGRELGPDMDKHLVDSTIERYQKERLTRAKALGQTQQPAPPPVARPSGGEVASDMVRALLGFVLLGGIIFVIATHIWMWWLIFLIFPIMGAIFGGSRRHRYYRYGGGDWGYYQQSREERRQMKIRKLEDKLSRYKSGQFDDED